VPDVAVGWSVADELSVTGDVAGDGSGMDGLLVRTGPAR
jgi:hypothetical protein